ncbi:MAG TPA: hypothetical protein VEI74_12650 [Candidatus Methylomirabilis sp.]|nr:hypothetical protein [Candidatus Methylomirabilis sp.]
MSPDHKLGSSTPLWRLVLVASLAGGLAEIIWVGLYALFTPLDGATVAREVTASLFPALAAGASSAWLGVAIHMTLAIALGCAFAYVIWKPLVRARGPLATVAVSALTLATVWTLNFFVVLPVLNPVFITLMPYSVTFASKMLFAVAMGMVLAGASRDVVAGKISRRISA